MKAALIAVGMAFVASHQALALAAEAGLIAAVTGQVVYILHSMRKAARP